LKAGRHDFTESARCAIKEARIPTTIVLHKYYAEPSAQWIEGGIMRLSITYLFANPIDKNQIRRLLSKCGLPTLYIHRYLKSFIVAKAGKRIVGVIGVEAYGRVGLLRSLCVDKAYRGRGIARMLTAKMLDYAHTRKIDRLYLFTWDAERFVSKLGFHKIDKKRIPKSIRLTWQFRSFSPYPVFCMMKKVIR
jgi:amino-acid N-acetyltransferase